MKTIFKKIAIASALAFLGFTSQAAIPANHAEIPQMVNLDMQLEINGQMVSQPHATLLTGEKGVFQQQAPNHNSFYVIEMTPTQIQHNQLIMKVEISRLKDGKKTLLSSPKIITANGEAATVEQTINGSPTLKFTATPTF
jgi:hypothetical protein